MSRIGKQPVLIPQGVKVRFNPEDRNFIVSGPHGELSRKLRSEVNVEVGEDAVTFTPKDQSIFSRALWGTYASHAINMIEGVNNRFEKKLVVEGIGYKVEVLNNSLILKVGFSHPVNVDIPEGLEVTVEKNTIIVKGFDKELVGSFCSSVKSIRKPEPYKGKGIRYENEVIRRKQGKRAT